LVLDEGKLIAEGTPAELRAQLEGDLLELEGPELASFAAQIESIAGVKAEFTENGLRLRLANGHSMLPKLIDALPDGMVKSVHLRQPTLGDVFVSLTGRSLEAP
jgi:ABC-2 type transport system ATP-binding protein